MAQGQCASFLNSIGYSEKHRDGISAQCPRCQMWHVVIKHTEKGVADYIGQIKSSIGPLGIAIEVKDGAERFNFNEIDADQWKWMRRWERLTGGTGWFWILMGTNQAGSTKTDYPRQTYLISRHVLCQIRRTMIHEGKISNLPLNPLAAQTRILTREKGLHAASLLFDWRCDWIAGQWIPHEGHNFWRQYHVEFNSVLSGQQSNRGSKVPGRNRARSAASR